MTFYAQIWLIDGHPVWVYTQDSAIGRDTIQAAPATVIDAEIDGDYLTGDDLRAAMNLTAGVLSVTGRSVLAQTTSVRAAINPSVEQVIAQMTRAIAAHVDAVAAQRNYDSGAHCASYVASTVPEWAAEAQAFVAWRDQVWIAALQLRDQMLAAQTVPTIPSVIAALPPMVWPA